MAQRITSYEIHWEKGPTLKTLDPYVKKLTGVFNKTLRAEGYFWPYDNELLPDITCRQLYEGSLGLSSINASTTVATDLGRFRVQLVLLSDNFGIVSGLKSYRTHTIKILGLDNMIKILKITQIH